MQIRVFCLLGRSKPPQQEGASLQSHTCFSMTWKPHRSLAWLDTISFAGRETRPIHRPQLGLVRFRLASFPHALDHDFFVQLHSTLSYQQRRLLSLVFYRALQSCTVQQSTYQPDFAPAQSCRLPSGRPELTRRSNDSQPCDCSLHASAMQDGKHMTRLP